MSAALNGAPLLRLVRPDDDPPPDLARACGWLADLYRLMPEWSPENAGPTKSSALAMKVLERAIAERDWRAAQVALVIVCGVRAALETQGSDMLDRLAEYDAAAGGQYREALRVMIREEYEARRDAFRAGVNEGQRAFCEGRQPRRLNQ